MSTAPEHSRSASGKRPSGVVIPHQARWRQRLAARVVHLLIYGVALTLRFRLQDETGALQSAKSQRFIFAIWHNRLALSLILYRRYIVEPGDGRRMAAMVSASRDGGFLTRVLELFGVQPVRGSSSRRGPQALREMVSWGEAGYDLAITPDGPRGPCYHVQDGVLSIAQLTGLPILPVSYHLAWKFRPKTWDRFQIPLPFSRCDVRVGRLMHVPRDSSDADRETLRGELEGNLREISKD